MQIKQPLMIRTGSVLTIGFFIYIVLGLMVGRPLPAFADKTAVRIEAPKSASPGTEVTIRVHITHEGNNIFHFTDWVFINANDREIGRWTFTAQQRPETDNFTRNITYNVDSTTRLIAQGNCNQHGSEGTTEAIILAASSPEDAPAPSTLETPDVTELPTHSTWQPAALLAKTVLVLGIANLLLLCFQLATGLRWIRVKFGIHRRTGKILVVVALTHAVLALFMNW